MGTLVEAATRIGIPKEELLELIELPHVARAVKIAAEHPNWSPDTVFKAIGRPSLYSGKRGLDLDGLRMQLVNLHSPEPFRPEPITNADARRVLGPMTMGRMRLAESVAKRRYGVIASAERALLRYIEVVGNGETLHPDLAEARAHLNEEIRKSEGGEL